MSEKLLAQQEDLYLTEGQSTSFTYGDSSYYQVRISGGSGSGSLHYRTTPITGKGTITSSTGRFYFVSPGTVWVEVYKDGSETSELIYERSKTLVIELTLNRRQITISVRNDVVVNIGEDVPSVLQNNYEVSGLLSGDSLGQLPEIYFVHDSEDFYKEDILRNVDMQDAEINGISYVWSANNNTWSISGTASSRSNYYFINSPVNLPAYLTKGERYSLEVSAGTPTTNVEFFKNNVSLVSYTLATDPDNSSSLKFSVPYDADGLQIYWSIESSTQVSVTCTIKILDTRVNILQEGQYPISARNAEVSNTEHYEPKIKYKSKNLIYQNTKYYNVYASYNNLGVITTNVVSAKPYDTVLFTVKATTGSQYFEHPSYFPDAHTPSTSSESSLTLLDESGYSIPYQRIEHPIFNPIEDTSSTGCLVSCTYSFVMPVGSSVKIQCVFYNWASSSNIPSSYTWPYTDVSSSGSTWSASGHAQDYVDALKFCYYARQFFFGEAISETTPPLMWGRSPGHRNKFYTDSFGVQRYLTRRDLISYIHRLSHAQYYSYSSSNTESQIASAWRTSNGGTSDPDYLFHLTTYPTNTPSAFLFSYAGHTPGGDSTGLVFGNASTPKVSPPIWSTPYPGVYYGESDPQVFSTDQTSSDLVIKTGPAISDYAWTRSSITTYTRSQYANDDYMLHYRHFNDISWGGWLGVMQGESSVSFNPMGAVTVQDAATVLWRYGVFRQFSVKESKQMPYSDADADVWAQNGPIKWMLANNLIHDTDPYGATLDPHSNIDRAEFAYMLMRFCMLYNW